MALPKRLGVIGPSTGIEIVLPLLLRAVLEFLPYFFFLFARLMRVLLPGKAISKIKVNEALN